MKKGTFAKRRQLVRGYLVEERVVWQKSRGEKGDYGKRGDCSEKAECSEREGGKRGLKELR